MAEVELALAASARPWSDRLHRFLADHGGARVRLVALAPEDVLNEAYDILIIDDVCSFLTPRLVDQVRREGRWVLGVFDSSDGADAKRRLLDCGVDDVIETRALPEEFLRSVAALQTSRPFPTPVETPQIEEGRPLGRLVAVGAPPGGCGATEVAVALAADLGAVLVDGDDVAPSVAHRLGLPLHPNIRTAIDQVHHHSGLLETSLQSAGDGFQLLAGLANGGDWSQVHPNDVEAVLGELLLSNDCVVVNVGAGLERPDHGHGRFGMARAVVEAADVVVGIGAPHPVGVARLIRWFREVAVLAPDAHTVAVINQVSRSQFRRSQLNQEVTASVNVGAIRLVPSDPRVTEAAWAGRFVPRGPFRRSVAKIAEECR